METLVRGMTEAVTNTTVARMIHHLYLMIKFPFFMQTG
jgi:hypothetical protein